MGDHHDSANYIQNDAQHSGGDGVDKKVFPARVVLQAGRNQEAAEREGYGDCEGSNMVDKCAKRDCASFGDGGEDADEQKTKSTQE